MAKMRRRDVVKERFWREAARRQRASGLSVRAFCRREKLSESAFYWWRRTLAERDATTKPLRRAKRSAAPAKLAQRPPAFVPAVVTDEPSRDMAIAMELNGGRVLRLPASFSVEKLAELVFALEARAAR